MAKKDKFSAIVTINGRRYDAESGRPIASFFSDGAAKSAEFPGDSSTNSSSASLSDSERFAEPKFSRAKKTLKKSRATKAKLSAEESRILAKSLDSARAKSSEKNPASATKKSANAPTKNEIHSAKKPRAKRLSKQARIAAEIAAEFGAATSESAKSSDKTSDFSRKNASTKLTDKSKISQNSAPKKRVEKSAKNNESAREKIAKSNENSRQKSVAESADQDIAAPWLQEFFDGRDDFAAQSPEKTAENDFSARALEKQNVFSAQDFSGKKSENYAESDFSTRAEKKSMGSGFSGRNAVESTQNAFSTQDSAKKDDISAQGPRKTGNGAKKLPKIERTDAKNLRRRSQHSMTLNRRFVKSPQLQQTLARHAIAAQSAAKPRTRPLFSATHTVTATPDEFVPHPLREAAVARQRAMQAEIRREAEREAREVARENLAKMQFATYGSTLKNALIAESLANAEPAEFVSVREKPARKMTKKSRKNPKIRDEKSAKNRKFRPATLASLGFAVALAAGYVAYVSAPNISVRIAAIDAGVDARTPVAVAGFSASGAAISEPGRVTLSYKKGDQVYSVAQSKATQNAENVNKKLASGDNREIYSRDATIYRAGDESSWVRDGVVYTVRGGNLGDLDVANIANSLE